MTPKEKAKELVERFNQANEATGSFITEFQVKQCALICVDEIMKGNENYRSQINNWQESNKFWQEVKQELLKQCKHKSSTWNNDIGANVCDECNQRV